MALLLRTRSTAARATYTPMGMITAPMMRSSGQGRPTATANHPRKTIA
jgi:hypothetical protein